MTAALVAPMAVAAASPSPATGTLYFARPLAKLVGGTALVPVECVGGKGSICSGELTLQAGQSTFEAPFSVTSGGGRTVSVPLTAGPGTSVVATATTVQSSGALATSSEALRLR